MQYAVGWLHSELSVCGHGRSHVRGLHRQLLDTARRMVKVCVKVEERERQPVHGEWRVGPGFDEALPAELLASSALGCAWPAASRAGWVCQSSGKGKVSNESVTL